MDKNERYSEDSGVSTLKASPNHSKNKQIWKVNKAYSRLMVFGFCGLLFAPMSTSMVPYILIEYDFFSLLMKGFHGVSQRKINVKILLRLSKGGKVKYYSTMICT